MSRIVLLLICIILLGACSSASKKPPPGLIQESDGESMPTKKSGKKPRTTEAAKLPIRCVAPRDHDERHYTAGGLYAPHISDSAPPIALNFANLPEPVPRQEPLATYGNRSPYTVLGKVYRVRDNVKGYRERGKASWYGYKFHGRHTSSREIYDMCSFSAAHKTLPLPSFVRVTNLDNGKSVVVRVNDRGPFHEGRIIDLSYAAAARLDMLQAGTARVEVRAIAGPDDDRRSTPGPEFAADKPQPASKPAAASATMPASTSPLSTPPTATAAPAQIVQIGSFADQANAQRLLGRLHGAGIQGARIDRQDNGTRVLWRVAAGPLANDAAQSLAKQVQSLGFGVPRVFSE